jgi:hypothetical protein
MVDWRLCPYCGAMMAEAIAKSEVAATGDEPTVANG